MTQAVVVRAMLVSTGASATDAAVSSRMTTAAGRTSVGMPSHSGCSAVEVNINAWMHDRAFCAFRTDVEVEQGPGWVQGSIAMGAPHARPHLHNRSLLQANVWIVVKHCHTKYTFALVVRTESGGMLRCSVSRSRRLRCVGRMTVRCTTAGTWVCSGGCCSVEQAMTDRCRVRDAHLVEDGGACCVDAIPAFVIVCIDHRNMHTHLVGVAPSRGTL